MQGLNAKTAKVHDGTFQEHRERNYTPSRTRTNAHTVEGDFLVRLPYFSRKTISTTAQAGAGINLAQSVCADAAELFLLLFETRSFPFRRLLAGHQFCTASPTARTVVKRESLASEFPYC